MLAIRKIAFLGLLALPMAGQTGGGDYNFVELRLRQDGPAASLIGTLRLQSGTPSSSAAYTASLAQGKETAQTVVGTASWTGQDSNSSLLTGLAASDSTLRIRIGQSGVLVGSGQTGNHELMLALRKATVVPLLRGRYSGAYLRFADGIAANAETCQVVFDADGFSVPSMAIVNHAAPGDDVNRLDSQGPATFQLAADGTGSMQFGTAGPITGTISIAASADGGVLIGTSTGGGTRDLLIVVRDIGAANEDFFAGTYWIAELGGESPYAEQSGGLRISSADGSLFSFGTGTASVAERVRIANQNVELSTTVRYGIGAGDGRMLGRRMINGVRNLAVADDAGLFVATWTGRSGELTLEHGLMVGILAPPLRLAALNAGSSAPVTASVAPGALVALYGANLTGGGKVLTVAPGFPLPTDLAGTRVLVNGIPAGLLMTSPGQVNLQIPYETPPGTASVEVRLGANAAIATLVVPVAAQSPGVFSLDLTGTGPCIATHADYRLITLQDPAQPNETVLIFLTGLGAVTPTIANGAAAGGPLRRVADSGIQVLFNSVAGQITYAGLSPGYAGLYQINVLVPDHASVDGNVALGIRTAVAYSDLADLSVLR